MYEALKNWGRWGPDDQRGALNHLTDARRAAAAGLVPTGRDASASPTTWPPSRCPSTPIRSSTTCWRRVTPGTPTGSPGTRRPVTTWPSTCTACWTTHVDALSHMFVRGQMYGGRPASEVRSDGARSNTVLSMADGVIGRGVLLDVPRALGSRLPRHRRGGHGGRPRGGRGRPGRDRSGPGDILLVAWGREARRRRPPGGSTGSPGSTPSACRGCTSARWPCSAATGSPTRCPSWARRSGRSRSTRSGSWPWASTSSTTCALAPLGDAVRGGRPVGVPVHHGPAAHPQGDRVPGQPGGRAVSAVP